MNKFDVFLEGILNGLSKGMTKHDIAKKHSKKLKKPIKDVEKVLDKELKKGENVEREHTTSKKVAKTIAKDHEVENLKYYTKLNKAEK